MSYNRTKFLQLSVILGLWQPTPTDQEDGTLQVLYFTPRLRDYFLAVVPDASVEFSLLDEMSLCFRMLASESGHACQATNLLRALRQSREATGLGLLEGHAQRGAQAADIEVSHSSPSGTCCRRSIILRDRLDGPGREWRTGRRQPLKVAHRSLCPALPSSSASISSA